MRKTFFAVVTALTMGFIWAVAVCLQTLRAQTVAVFSNGSMRVVVDAGHGGIDYGVRGRETGVKESDLNLSIAMELKNALEEMGFEVILTRKTDAGLYDTTAPGFKKRDMQRRKEIIQDAAPALILSVHQNYYPAQSVRGGQTFYSKTNEGGMSLANAVQQRINALYNEEGVKARKVMEGEYFMLTCYPCPSVIVECGFLSNPVDEELLKTKAWQRRLSSEIAAGVLAYLAQNSV